MNGRFWTLAGRQVGRTAIKIFLLCSVFGREKTESLSLLFVFVKLCLEVKFNKKEGSYEKRYYEPFRRLYAN